METEVLEFSISRQVIPVRLTDEKTGVVHNLKLKEMLGSDRDKYLNKLATRMRMDVHGHSSVKDFTGLQADLICRVLEDEDGKLVTEEFVQGLPSKTQAALFKKIQEMNGLNEDEDKAKNEE